MIFSNAIAACFDIVNAGCCCFFSVPSSRDDDDDDDDDDDERIDANTALGVDVNVERAADTCVPRTAAVQSILVGQVACHSSK